MSLLGIDVGTSGCKAAAFSLDGRMLAFAYQEYEIQRPQPGWAELDSQAIWGVVQRLIQQVVLQASGDPVRALAVSSLGESTVPVTNSRQILGPSPLNFDTRGEEYLPDLRTSLDDQAIYRINGNTLGNHYTLTKLMWLRDHQPDLYHKADHFLFWGGYVAFMLGAEPRVDYSLANRSLFFDLDRETWSTEVLTLAGLEAAKLPPPVPSGKVIGTVSRQVAEGLGLPAGIPIVSGAHDQCANAVGGGVIHPGLAVYGMGTYICITPIFSQRKDPTLMIERGLNTEHHAVPGCYVSFIYNQGGSLVKWFRDTFAAADHQQAKQSRRDIYADLIAEIPDGPSQVMVLPHFAITGPPEFISDSAGVIAGLKLETRRGEVLKGILEGLTFYLKECVDALPPTGISVDEYRAVGGGSKSDAWIQVCADILGRPFIRPVITEAGALGAAIIAGVGSGIFPNYQAAVQAMVHLDRHFEPDIARHQHYAERYELYRQLGPLVRNYLRRL
jgi:xylulokinase